MENKNSNKEESEYPVSLKTAIILALLALLVGFIIGTGEVIFWTTQAIR